MSSTNIQSLVRLTCAAGVAAVVAGCGGGGGGGGGFAGGNGDGSAYSGATEFAAIDQGNGETLVTGAYQNGGSGSTIGTVLALQAPAHVAGDPSGPRLLAVSEAVLGVLSRADGPTVQGAGAARAVQTVTDVQAGPCGGSAAYTISVDDQSGAFSGAVTFSSYCDGGDTLSGGVGFSGAYDLNSGVFSSLTMTLDGLDVVAGSDVFSAEGEMVVDLSTVPAAITADVVFTDSASGKTYWARDLTITVQDEAAYDQITLAGDFYDPDYGYVTLSTPAGSELRIASGGEWPYSGQLTATGEGGSTATLTALSSTSYQVDIDDNGDGTVDLTEIGNWADL